MQFSADWKASYVLRVYDANTSQVRWTQGEPSYGTSSCGLAVKGTNVYLIGVEPGKFFVKAFNGKTGALKWQDAFDNLGEMDFDADVAADSDHVSVVAYSQSVTPSLDYAWQMTVRIYKAGSGALVQEQRKVGSGRNGEVDIALKGNKVYVVGEGVDEPTLACATEGRPEDTTVTIEGRTIKVNGEVFFVKGMNYAPSPIGSKDEWPPHLDWFYTTPKSGHGWSKIWDRDFPYLTDMGVNVIKVYSWQACVPEHPEWEPFDHGDFLKKLKDNNIYIIPQVYSPSLTQLNNLDQSNWRNDPVAKWTIQVMAEIKNSPYKSQIIGYQAGNELNNGGYFTDKFWDNYNFMCGKVKEMAEGKPVMIGVVDDSMQTAQKWFTKMTNVDVWGINSYRAQIGSPDPFGPPAAGFTSLFTTWVSASSSSPKPMIITEMGPPASMRKNSAPCTDQGAIDILPDNAKAQADYYEVLWNRGNAATYDDLVRNSSVCSKSHCNGAPCTNCQAATCSGAFLFEWTDEWWKYKTGNPALHEASKEKGDAFPGKCGDEEYFGIFDVSVNGRPPETPDEGKADNVAARAAVARIKTLLAATNP